VSRLHVAAVVEKACQLCLPLCDGTCHTQNQYKLVNISYIVASDNIEPSTTSRNSTKCGKHGKICWYTLNLNMNLLCKYGISEPVSTKVKRFYYLVHKYVSNEFDKSSTQFHHGILFKLLGGLAFTIYFDSRRD